MYTAPISALVLYTLSSSTWMIQITKSYTCPFTCATVQSLLPLTGVDLQNVIMQMMEGLIKHSMLITGKPLFNRHITLAYKIYIFLFGELTNAWLCFHLEHIQSAWTTIFFLIMRHKDIEDSKWSLITVNQNGISQKSYPILHILGKLLIGLIISHCKF